MAGRNVDRGHAARLRQRVDPVHDLSAIALTLRVRREHDPSQRRPAAHLDCWASWTKGSLESTVESALSTRPN